MPLNPAFKSGAGDIYNQSLQYAQNLYNQVQAGYAGLMANQQAAQAGVTAGYNRLSTSVLGRLQGADAAERQRIVDQYTQMSGQEAQGLTNRGLGNTTVANAVQRGLELDRAKAGVEVGSRYAQLGADFESRIGLAGLDWQGRAIGQNLELGSRQFNAAASFAPTFANIYGQMGSAAQRDWEIYNQRGMQAKSLLAGAQGQANQMTMGYAQQANQRGMAADQLAYRYDALGQQGQQFGAQMDFRGQQLAQQNAQFEAARNQAYDFRGGTYGIGAPSPGLYSNRLPTPNIQYAPTGGRK